MKMACENRETVALVSLTGSFTGDFTERFKRTVDEQMGLRVRDFVINLDRTEFIDSQGLETLLWLQDECRERLGQLRLACADQTVTDILKLTRLNGQLDTHPTVDEALQSLA